MVKPDRRMPMMMEAFNKYLNFLLFFLLLTFGCCSGMRTGLLYLPSFCLPGSFNFIFSKFVKIFSGGMCFSLVVKQLTPLDFQGFLLLPTGSPANPKHCTVSSIAQDQGYSEDHTNPPGIVVWVISCELLNLSHETWYGGASS